MSRAKKKTEVLSFVFIRRFSDFYLFFVLCMIMSYQLHSIERIRICVTVSAPRGRT